MKLYHYVLVLHAIIQVLQEIGEKYFLAVGMVGSG